MCTATDRYEWKRVNIFCAEKDYEMIIYENIGIADNHTHIDVNRWLNATFQFEWTEFKYFDIE